MIRKITTKDKNSFLDYCSRFSRKKDIFIYKNNEKLFLDDLKLASRIFKDITKRSTLGFIYGNKDIEGLILVFKNNKINQLNLVAKNRSITYKLLRFLLWNTKNDLQFIGNKYNPVIRSLKRFKFRFEKIQDNDIILNRKYYKDRKQYGSNQNNSVGSSANKRSDENRRQECIRV